MGIFFDSVLKIEESLQYWRTLVVELNLDVQSIRHGLVEFVRNVNLVLLH